MTHGLTFINSRPSYPDENGQSHDIIVKVKNKSKKYCERIAKESKCDPDRWLTIINMSKNSTEEPGLLGPDGSLNEE